MNDPEYRAEHGIVAKPGELVKETASFTRAEWEEMDKLRVALLHLRQLGCAAVRRPLRAPGDRSHEVDFYDRLRTDALADAVRVADHRGDVAIARTLHGAARELGPLHRRGAPVPDRSARVGRRRRARAPCCRCSSVIFRPRTACSRSCSPSRTTTSRGRTRCWPRVRPAIATIGSWSYRRLRSYPEAELKISDPNDICQTDVGKPMGILGLRLAQLGARLPGRAPEARRRDRRVLIAGTVPVASGVLEHGDAEVPTEQAGSQRDVRAAALVFAVFIAVAGWALVARLGNYFWFHGDEWDFLVTRDGGDLGDLLPPAQRAPHLVPLIVYRVLWNLFGLRSYTPYQLPVILMHLTAAVLLRAVMRRCRVNPWIATAAASVFVLFGPGEENIIWAFQIGFTGTLVFGLAQLLLADHDGSFGRRDWLALGFGCLAVLSSGLAPIFVASGGCGGVGPLGLAPRRVPDRAARDRVRDVVGDDRSRPDHRSVRALDELERGPGFREDRRSRDLRGARRWPARSSQHSGRSCWWSGWGSRGGPCRSGPGSGRR